MLVKGLNAYAPQLTFVSGRMDVYKAVSRRIRNLPRIYGHCRATFTDEAFRMLPRIKQNILLVTGHSQKQSSKKIREELHLIASAGVSYNKFLAKIASDYQKPDGLCTIHPSQAEEFIKRLPIESLKGDRSGHRSTNALIRHP